MARLVSTPTKQTAKTQKQRRMVKTNPFSAIEPLERAAFSRRMGLLGSSQEQTPKFSQTSTFRLPPETQYFYCTVRTVEPLIEPALAVIVDFPAANARATP